MSSSVLGGGGYGGLSANVAGGPDPRTFLPTGGNGNGGTSPVRATVSVSDLAASEYPTQTFDVAETASWYWDGLPGCYDFWQCLNEYSGDPGVIVVPTSNTAGTNVAIAHSSPMRTLKKKWAAFREGAPPRLPPIDLGDPNWVFVNEVQGIREMRVSPDGSTIVYECNGVYEYQALDASLAVRSAEVQPFLIESAFGSRASVTSAVNWVEGQLSGQVVIPTSGSGQTGSLDVVNGGGGQNPLGGS